MAVLSSPLGCSLFGPLLGSAFVCLCCLSFRACLCASALHVSSLCFLFASPFVLGLFVVWLWSCGCFPPSPLGCIRVAPWPSKFLVLLVPPSGYLVASATAWLPCLLLGVLWCIASSLHFVSWQQRPLALCGVIDQPSTPWGICCCGALRSLTEVFIFMMIQDPPRAPLSYTPATLVECVTFSALVLVCLPGALSFCFFLGCVCEFLCCPVPSAIPSSFT